MNDPFFIKAHVADKITYYHLVVFVIALPFDRLYSELALGSLFVHTLIHLQRKDMRVFGWKDLLVASSVYLLTLVATAYSQYRSEAFSEWERQAALLLFPLVVLLSRFEFRRYVLNFVLASAFVCALTIVYLYFSAFSNIAAHHLRVSAIFSNAFLNHNFAAPIDMHATYFSMYITLGAAGCVFAFLGTGTKTRKVFYATMFLVLLMGLIQLSSRAVLISFAVIMNIVVPCFWIGPVKRRRYVLVSLLSTAALAFVLTKTEALKTRFTVELKEDLTKSDATNNLLEPRAARWSAAKDLMLQSPVYGHGSGSEIPLLREVYYEHKLYNSFLNFLNIHNQYLSMVIKTGLIGLSVLLFTLCAGFKRAVQRRDGLFFSFLVIVSIVCFSENVLDGNKGIFFFAAFYSLFYIDKKRMATQK